jgi:4-alpha-glucanotransferase
VTTDDRGIDDRYLDVAGREHPTTRETHDALVTAMGPDTAGAYADVIVVRAPAPWTPERSGDLLFEDGATRTVEAGRSIRLPLGYHDFRPDGDAGGHARRRDETIRLIVAPQRCYLPENLRVWGWAAQLYAARSSRSWGIGDLADLRRLGRWGRGLGAGVVMVNPLTAVTPVLPLEASPYFPSSRRFRNPLYLRVEEVPGASELGDELERLAVSGRNLDQQRRINRDAVFTLKMQALEKCIAVFARSGAPARAAFDAYRIEQGTALDRFATFCAIAELHGKDWRRWPEELRRPDAPATVAFAVRHAMRVTFHAWLQWLLDDQLRRASREIGIVQDLPIGLDAAGADAWDWQELLAQGVSVGVPPDELNPAGQDWGLTPFVPGRLRAAGYQPMIETIRATARHGAGLRIDHVMGLFRLFWIPRGSSPRAGAFVRTRVDELLAIIALESERARVFVVGEDLGTVEPGVREKMADWRMLSYRLLCFESAPAAELPELALAAVSTHDLPTIAGLWTGADRQRSGAAGVAQNEAGLRTLRDRVARCTNEPTADLPRVIEDVHAALGAAPSRVLLASLDDALAVDERPNLPGAPPDWPNWSLALPLLIDELEKRPLPAAIARALTRR